jgi:pyruvate,water dikinase
MKGLKTICLTGKKAELEMKKRGLPEKEEYGDIIKGITACKGSGTGIAKGPAKIVRNKFELGKIQKGDIMISVTTHPEYVPAMSRAAAIVTDEGGLTCHAAIVAREINTPCIVGSKVSTKAFKDGDMVEVDAIKGTIKKIA